MFYFGEKNTKDEMGTADPEAATYDVIKVGDHVSTNVISKFNQLGHCL